MDNEQLVQRVVAEVLRKFGMEAQPPAGKARLFPKRALANYTGGTIGFEQSLLVLQKIQAAHVEVSVVLSTAAEKMIDLDQMKEQLGRNIPLITTQSPYPGKLLREVDFVLSPVLTQNTAAKLAYTLADSLPSTLIFQGLMLGKPILAAGNAADPRDDWRIKMNMGNSPPGFSSALQQNLKKIASYGIELVSVEELAIASQKLIERIDRKLTDSLQSENQGTSPEKKSLVDVATIKVAAGKGLHRIVIGRNSIVTPLAREVAREYGIEMVQEPG